MRDWSRYQSNAHLRFSKMRKTEDGRSLKVYISFLGNTVTCSQRNSACCHDTYAWGTVLATILLSVQLPPIFSSFWTAHCILTPFSGSNDVLVDFYITRMVMSLCYSIMTSSPNPAPHFESTISRWLLTPKDGKWSPLSQCWSAWQSSLLSCVSSPGARRELPSVLTIISASLPTPWWWEC